MMPESVINRQEEDSIVMEVGEVVNETQFEDL